VLRQCSATKHTQYNILPVTSYHDSLSTAQGYSTEADSNEIEKRLHTVTVVVHSNSPDLKHWNSGSVKCQHSVLLWIIVNYSAILGDKELYVFATNPQIWAKHFTQVGSLTPHTTTQQLHKSNHEPLTFTDSGYLLDTQWKRSSAKNEQNALCWDKERVQCIRALPTDTSSLQMALSMTTLTTCTM